MIIDQDIDSYVVLDDTTIYAALSALNEHKRRILFVVNHFNVLVGSFSDGDFRRWIIAEKDFDLNKAIKDICNPNVVFATDSDSQLDVNSMFSDKILAIPIVDMQHRLISIARPGTAIFSIGKHNITQDGKTFIIAEVGNNHNGSVDEAKKLVDSAILSGADAVKFQLRDMSTLYAVDQGSKDPSADLGVQYVLDLLERYQLNHTDLKLVRDYCSEKGIDFLCTPFDKNSVDFLESIGVPAYKIASADLTNHLLINYLCKKNKPLIVSTGMSSEGEIERTVSLLKKNNAQFILLHCNSTYPCPDEDINLLYMDRLREVSGGVIGYSGHDRGIAVPISAVALGARVIEKHFTHDKTQEGNDHKVSLLPNEFKEMVQSIRQVERALGSVSDRSMSQGEMINRETLGKSLVAQRYIKAGEVISASMVDVKSPGKGLAPCYINDLVGRVSKRDLNPGGFFYASDIGSLNISPRNYRFNTKFGLPVRYHDFKSIMAATNLRFVEFHLSYKDLELDPSEFLPATSDVDCIVHAPELFSGDHLLDLCSIDETYRKRSINELQRVLHHANKIKQYFLNKNSNVLVVVNVGGFSENRFLSGEEVSLRLENLNDSIAVLNLNGIELLPQTMPPFPWHFGGQQFHNIFVDPKQTLAWCQKNKFRICLDTSHTALSCEHLGIDFIDAISTLAPVTAHLHIADAKGTREEGLQIGMGDINFTSLFHKLESEMADPYWLPEIWQGHKNNGEGFWMAFERLEQISTPRDKKVI